MASREAYLALARDDRAEILAALAPRLGRTPEVLEYDVIKLAGGEHGMAALANRAMLVDVIKHKKVFYNASYARYDDCLSGGLRLVPDEEDLAGLEADYKAMAGAGMFYGKIVAALTSSSLLMSSSAYLAAGLNWEGSSIAHSKAWVSRSSLTPTPRNLAGWHRSLARCRSRSPSACRAGGARAAEATPSSAGWRSPYYRPQS